MKLIAHETFVWNLYLALFILLPLSFLQNLQNQQLQVRGIDPVAAFSKVLHFPKEPQGWKIDCIPLSDGYEQESSIWKE
jgi:hypothetical protein